MYSFYERLQVQISLCAVELGGFIVAYKPMQNVMWNFGNTTFLCSNDTDRPEQLTSFSNNPSKNTGKNV